MAIFNSYVKLPEGIRDFQWQTVSHQQIGHPSSGPARPHPQKNTPAPPCFGHIDVISHDAPQDAWQLPHLNRPSW